MSDDDTVTDEETLMLGARTLIQSPDHSPRNKLSFAFEVPIARHDSNDTLATAGSFRRRAPMHTNSFELMHRRSAVRKDVKRRAIKMTLQNCNREYLIFYYLMTVNFCRKATNVNPL
jgi:hypothetical protein